METPSRPDCGLAKKVLPAPLFKALVSIFSQNIRDCVLVGGTALSGFYAGHRRSDDLDLFVKNEAAFTQAILALNSLKKLSAEIKESAHSNQYFKAQCSLEGHAFTVDIVLDENLFNAGKHEICDCRIAVAGLPTIFMMKSAALLSRCSAKDLYDMLWLFQNLKDATAADIITEGKKIDGGMRAETVLYSVSSSQIRKEACGFALDPDLDEKKVYARILKFKKKLAGELGGLVRDSANSGLKPVMETIKSLSAGRKKPREKTA